MHFIKGMESFFSSIKKNNLLINRREPKKEVAKDVSNWNKRKFQKIAFIAGGTGIAPLYSVSIRKIKFLCFFLFNKIMNRMRQLKEKNLELFLIFANKTEVKLI
jgi:hypothetical protein